MSKTITLSLGKAFARITDAIGPRPVLQIVHDDGMTTFVQVAGHVELRELHRGLGEFLGVAATVTLAGDVDPAATTDEVGLLRGELAILRERNADLEQARNNLSQEVARLQELLGTHEAYPTRRGAELAHEGGPVTVPAGFTEGQWAAINAPGGALDKLTEELANPEGTVTEIQVTYAPGHPGSYPEVSEQTGLKVGEQMDLEAPSGKRVILRRVAPNLPNTTLYSEALVGENVNNNHRERYLLETPRKRELGMVMLDFDGGWHATAEDGTRSQFEDSDCPPPAGHKYDEMDDALAWLFRRDKHTAGPDAANPLDVPGDEPTETPSNATEKQEVTPPAPNPAAPEEVQHVTKLRAELASLPAPTLTPGEPVVCLVLDSDDPASAFLGYGTLARPFEGSDKYLVNLDRAGAAVVPADLIRHDARHQQAVTVGDQNDAPPPPAGEETTVTATPPAANGELLTKDERADLVGLVTEKGVTKERFLAIIFKHFGAGSTAELTRGQRDHFVKSLLPLEQEIPF